jgi:putative hydrolase
MKIEVDTHTHSIASLHAYSTISELAESAKKNNLRGFVLTEHGPALQGLPHPYYFSNLKVIPNNLNGVLFFCGVELNITDSSGGVDLTPKYLRSLDFVMAGFHDACFEPGTEENNTKALIAAIANPLVDGISHPGNGLFPVNYEEVVRAAVQYGKTLEINNSSFKVRKGSNENCRELARLCKNYGALVSCGSDAHYKDDVGNVTTALSVIEEAGIQPEKVINSSLERFLEFSAGRKSERKTFR